MTCLVRRTQVRVELAEPLEGHAPLRSDYAEEWWLPIVGPTAMWALRRLVSWAGVAGQPVTIPLDVLAGAVGVKASAGPNSPIVRTVHRIISFGLAAIDDDVVVVRDTVPAIPARLAGRIDPEARATFGFGPGLG